MHWKASDRIRIHALQQCDLQVLEEKFDENGMIKREVFSLCSPSLLQAIPDLMVPIADY